MDYCAFLQQKRGGEQEGKGGERKGEEAVWKARVMRCSRRGRLALLGKRRTSILFNPWGDPWPLAYSRLHQVQALTAGSSCTHCKLIFHTLCKHWGRSHMKMWIPFHLSTPPSFFFFMPFYCQGLKLQPGWEGGELEPIFLSPLVKCVITKKTGVKMIRRDVIITRVLIRGMSCIITAVFDNAAATTLGH